MAREARRESLTDYYHIMMRGNNKEMIFRKAIEKQYFKEQLCSQIEKGLISLIAYCIMNNHVHLLINAKLNNMSNAFKYINTKFAGNYNYKYDRVGHVFQGRYKSEPIDYEEYFIQAIRYIHNNPVKAKLVDNPSEYKWSSYRYYLNYEDPLVNPDEKNKVMLLFSESMSQFIEFHKQTDSIEFDEFLEIKEDIEYERLEKSKTILNNYCKKYGMRDIREIKDLNNKKEILAEVIYELVSKSHLPYSQISELTNTNKSTIYKIIKQFK